jgi:SRSO17 transposase
MKAVSQKKVKSQAEQKFFCQKKNFTSTGVSRQWCGQIVQYENCQVGVFAALCRGNYVSLTDVRLFLPEEIWINDEERCLAAGVPAENIVAKRKQDLALEMVKHARELSVRLWQP